MGNLFEKEYIRPFPPPFIMHAMKLLRGAGLTDTQKQKIASLMLTYHKRCLSEETKFVDGIIKILENPA
ncbi:MAG: hypothetical protein RBS37_13420 [Bacteroidales bacterium]|nr:hypothetical protein [Bacteroidales bacterium]